MLIDTRDQPPEPERNGDEGRWLGSLLAWLFPWPAIIGWLWLAGLLFDGLAGAIFALTAIILTSWRLTKLFPSDGLSSHSQ